MDTRDDVAAATTQALAAVHRITDRMLEPEIARAVLIQRNLGEDDSMPRRETGHGRSRGFPWRMVRVQ